eukprot:932679-Amorphochlora_amoeboformis.AAC.1
MENSFGKRGTGVSRFLCYFPTPFPAHSRIRRPPDDFWAFATSLVLHPDSFAQTCHSRPLLLIITTVAIAPTIATIQIALRSDVDRIAGNTPDRILTMTHSLGSD